MPLCLLAFGEEKIIRFESHIQVHPDSSMTVTENILVKSERRKIRRGIYRDFPTAYKDRFGSSVNTGFKIKEVLKNGRPEPYHTKRLSNGIRVYIGKKDVFIKPGEYTYTLTYVTDRQLGYFKDLDELYWNVTGNGWEFTIDKAIAYVKPPPGASIIQYAAYTGPRSAKGRDYTVSFDDPGTLVFATTRPLKPGEGLTIAYAWPKGFVKEPTQREKIMDYLGANLSMLAALLGLILVSVYYCFSWIRVGRDPEKGTIIPLFEPPKGLSPAASRFVWKMGFDNKAFASAVMNMAVKGYLKIEEEAGDFILRKSGKDAPPLATAEKKIADKLFFTSNAIEVDRINHSRFKKAIKTLTNWLRLEFEKKYFNTNSQYLVPGLVITIFTLGGLVFSARDMGTAGFMTIWLSIWTIGTSMLVLQVINSWREALRSRGIKLLKGGGALFLTAFSVPFVGGEIFGLFIFAKAVSLLAAFLLLLIAGVNIIFYQLLKAPTLGGRKIMDQIEGFRLYLSTAEAERLNILHPPEITPQIFEKYLPYAMALDVEHEWSEKFARALKATEAGEYSPSWYTGSHWNSYNIAGFSDHLGSAFSSAISSASSPPGSRSGSGGGGSSGGGGGGGGGGGW